jgi:hypothetical protein
MLRSLAMFTGLVAGASSFVTNPLPMKRSDGFNGHFGPVRKMNTLSLAMAEVKAVKAPGRLAIDDDALVKNSVWTSLKSPIAYGLQGRPIYVLEYLELLTRLATDSY